MEFILFLLILVIIQGPRGGFKIMENTPFRDLDKKLKSVKIEGFVISKEERIFEYFKNKKVKEKPSKVYSVTKSIVSLLIGILIDKGLIRNVHQPISDFFTDMDVEKEKITILHLLTMTSGQKVTNFGLIRF